MSTWISKILRRGGLRPALVICASVLLSGCIAQTGGGSGVPVVRKAALAGGAVVVVPPAGYCLDKSSITDRPGGSFALIASCESLTGRRAGSGPEPAVITVSVTPPRQGREQPEAARLAEALGSGVALSEANGDGLIVVQVQGAGALPGDRGDTRHWRGAMVVNDRLVGLAIYGAAGSDIAGRVGERLLVATAEAIRENSPFLAAERTVPQETRDETGQAVPESGLRTLFGNLFP